MSIMRFGMMLASLSLACAPTTDDDAMDDPVPVCDPSFAVGEPPGTTVWSQQLGAELPEANQLPGAVTVDTDGAVYAVARIYGDEFANSDGWSIALAADGTIRWNDRYRGAAGLGDVLEDVTISPAGDVLVVAVEETERVVAEEDIRSEFVIVVLAYGPDGIHRWRQEIERSADALLSVGYPPAIAVHEDGRIVVVVSERIEGGWGRLLFAELTADGRLGARRTYLEDGYRGLELADIEMDSADHLYTSATGTPSVGDEDHHWLARWTPHGELDWSVGTPLNRARAAGVSARHDGAVALARFDTQDMAPTISGQWLGRYDRSGHEIWTQRFQSATSVQPIAVTAGCDGEVLALTLGEGMRSLLRYSADGEALAEFDVSGDTALVGIATDPGGNPVLAGHRLDPASGVDVVITKLAR